MVAGTLPPSSANSISNLKLNGIEKGECEEIETVYLVKFDLMAK